MDLFGNKIGIVCGAQSFTYAEFGERAQKLASGLVKEGIQPGDRVAYLSFNTNQLLEGYYGVVQARAIVMPLNVRLSPVGTDQHFEPLRGENVVVRTRLRFRWSKAYGRNARRFNASLLWMKPYPLLT